jgi:predicted ATPase
MKRKNSSLKPPFLKSIELDAARVPVQNSYPFSIPAIAAEHFRVDFTSAVTIIVGVNGSGKSTILEAIAGLCGFGKLGGNKNYDKGEQDVFGSCLRASWLPKITNGFYTRAESFYGFIKQVDQIAQDSGADIYEGYGGRSLTTRSHGEAYLSVFRQRIQGQGIFILDEPELALSPSMQIEFLRTLRAAEKNELGQFIIATHSPLLMAYPGATVLHLTEHGIVERPFQLTDHFRILKEFYLNPDNFMDAIFAD